MKQKIYITALLAGMLALAGCGGGSSSNQTVTMVDCPDGSTTAKAATLDDCKKAPPPAPPGLVAADVMSAITAFGKSPSHDNDGPDSIHSAIRIAVSSDGDTQVTLRQKGGAVVTPTNSAFSVRGWSGDRFSFDNGDEMGTVISNREGSVATGGDYWTDYFSTTARNGAILTAADETTGRLTIGAITNAQKYANFGGSDLIINEGSANAQPGKFLGVDGKYECMADTCTIDKGTGTTAVTTGTIYFTPTTDTDNPLNGIFVEGTAEADDEYIWFGYWMSEGDIHTWVGQEGYDQGLDADLTDNNVTVTYKGSAGGFYTTGTAAGEFAAKADLTAYFGDGVLSEDDAVATANHNTISGTISDFASTTGGANLSAWKLTLDKTTISTNVVADGTTSSTSGPEGQWDATFHEFGASGGDVSTDAPDAVTGQFTGSFSATDHVAGSFAATCPASTCE